MERTISIRPSPTVIAATRITNSPRRGMSSRLSGSIPCAPVQTNTPSVRRWFRKATIHLENDNDIEIEASENCLENRYVGKITLNGNVPKQLFIECAELLKGRKFSSI